MSRFLLDQALMDSSSAELTVNESQEKEIRDSLKGCGLRKVALESKKKSDQENVLTVTLPETKTSTAISVVIPCYNRTETDLVRVVESTKRALNELPIANHEILLVDDASLVRVREFEGTRVLRNEMNQGVSVARNRGFSESKE